jgi:hypothetical protein
MFAYILELASPSLGEGQINYARLVRHYITNDWRPTPTQAVPRAPDD